MPFAHIEVYPLSPLALDSVTLEALFLKYTDVSRGMSPAATHLLFHHRFPAALAVHPTAGKFRCLECGKNFKGPEYVRKHIRKMHAHLIETIRQSAHTEAAAGARARVVARRGGDSLVSHGSATKAAQMLGIRADSLQNRGHNLANMGQLGPDCRAA